eukprot:TRINITY_DN1340_c0_g1_i20.p1 TRINITY_DN1340_c0_g1~~TRINITY_DN1340_c0_g1_i20.p1  ORF type:complete len:286 (-),score=74.43 TRINITY_DN1340_c0_g1_i20:47-904(-)
MAVHMQFSGDAQKHVQAYLDYYNIVGNDDNGQVMSEAEFEAYKKKVQKARENRLYVAWRNSKGMDCKMVGPSSSCFCGHRYRDHNFDNVKTKEVHCKDKKCACRLFSYVPIYGSADLKCLCKHSYMQHDPRTKKCKTAKCTCSKFISNHSCSCGQRYPEHTTVFESREERQKQGRAVDPPHMKGNLAAGMGGVTDFASLADGAEREEMMRPMLPGAAHRAIEGGKEEQKEKVGGAASESGTSAFELFMAPHQYGGTVKKIMPKPAKKMVGTVSYTHLTLPTIYSV